MKKEDRKIIFEEYKLYIQTAENNSNRRQTANNFFLSFNSLLISMTGFLIATTGKSWLVLLSFIGVISSILWVTTINSYRQLNSGKFKVIHDLEEHFPYALFKKEWDYLGKGEVRKKYKKLTLVETGVPYTFIILYGCLILIQIIPNLILLFK